MPKIELEKGFVMIKDRLSRGERRQIELSIQSKIDAEFVDKKVKMNAGQAIAAQNEAMFFVIDKIEINGEIKPVTQKTLDNEDWITDDEYSQIEASANEILSNKKRAEEVKKK